MFKVMVVDDEPVVRLAIKSLDDWEKWGFSIEFEASNGKQALQTLEKNPNIEIVITDMNMPMMDGLEFISAIKKNGLEPEIVVLSAYDDYNLVRQAFKLGVKDYLLKSEINQKSVLALLQAAAELIHKKRKMTWPVGNIDAGLDVKYMKEYVLKSLFEGHDIPDMDSQIKELKLRIGSKNLVVCFICVDNYQKVEQKYEGNALKRFTESVVHAIAQVLTNLNLGEVVCLSPQEYAVCFSFENESEYTIYSQLNKIVNQIKYYLLNYVNISVTIGISDAKTGYQRIRELYLQAESNVRYRFIFGKGRLIFPSDTVKIQNNLQVNIHEKDHNLLQALKDLNRERTFEELDHIFTKWKMNDSGKINQIYSYYIHLIFKIVNYLDECGEDPASIFGEEVDFYEKIKRFETEEEIQAWFKYVMERILNYLEEKKEVKINRDILKGQAFIKTNYIEDISLKMLSDYLELSEGHVSRLFVKYTGKTFTDYLIGIRIQKAKDFMKSTNLKVYEISQKVGYENTEHFSRIFKKVTGHTPNGYKNLFR